MSIIAILVITGITYADGSTPTSSNITILSIQTQSTDGGFTGTTGLYSPQHNQFQSDDINFTQGSIQMSDMVLFLRIIRLNVAE